MRSLNVLIPVIGLAYFALFTGAVVVILVAITGTIQLFEYLFIAYVVGAVGAAFMIWRETRIGFILGAVVSGLLVLTFTFAPKPDDLVSVLSNPAGTGEFVDRITTFPLLVASLAYSILGLREKWPGRAGAKEPTSFQVVPRTSVIGLLTAGFILGGLVVGLLAGATLSGLIAGSGTAADITIVQGAGVSSNGQFYVPANFTVVAGGTVAWVNRDTTAHTVTSATGLLDSGNMNSGALYRFTFSTTGTFEYVCTYHAWMRGTVTVT